MSPAALRALQLSHRQLGPYMVRPVWTILVALRRNERKGCFVP